MKRRRHGFSVVDGEPILSDHDGLAELLLLGEAIYGARHGLPLPDGARDALERACDEELGDEEPE